MLVALLAIAVLAIAVVNSVLIMSVRSKTLHLEQMQWQTRIAIEEARADTINAITSKEGTGV